MTSRQFRGENPPTERGRVAINGAITSVNVRPRSLDYVLHGGKRNAVYGLPTVTTHVPSPGPATACPGPVCRIGGERPLPYRGATRAQGGGEGACRRSPTSVPGPDARRRGSSDAAVTGAYREWVRFPLKCRSPARGGRRGSRSNPVRVSRCSPWLTGRSFGVRSVRTEWSGAGRGFPGNRVSPSPLHRAGGRVDASHSSWSVP